MKTKFVEPEVVERLKKCIIEHERDDAWLILRVALETGMRIGDVVALRSGNLRDGKIVYTAQKTKKQAEICINQPLWREISAKKSKNPKKWIFPSPYDIHKHITRQCVWQRVKRACNFAGVDSSGIAPHSFRKVFAVEMFKRDGLEATQNALQHDRASTTQIYALSDFTSGENGLLPLLRRDLPLIVSEVLAYLHLPHPGGEKA